MPIRVFILHFVLLLTASCALDRPYRTTISTPLPEPLDCLSAHTIAASASANFESCNYIDEAQTAGQYSVGFVEFDDQGWLHDKQQPANLIEKIEQIKARDPDTQFLIVVYAHGWKHNARSGDPDVQNFHQLLQRLDQQERAAERSTVPVGKNAANTIYKRREIVGVYIGWRGSELPIPFLENVTFWSRKNAAERVGNGAVKQLLMQLNQLRARLNRWETSNRLAKWNETQLLIIGHSFGGLVLYHALHSEIIEHGLVVDGKTGKYRVAKGIGDLVVLVNPAFEGSLYEPLWNAAVTRGCYPEKQRPIMAIVTSDADYATRYTFPLGRLYTYLTQSAPQAGERKSVLNTVGHLQRYRTHRLEVFKDSPTHVDLGTIDSRTSTSHPDLAPFGKLRQQRRDLSKPSESVRIGDAVLTNLDNPPQIKRFPYLVISTTKDLIADHSDIWRKDFTTFMTEFVASAVVPDPQEGELDEAASADQSNTGLECRAFK